MPDQRLDQHFVDPAAPTGPKDEITLSNFLLLTVPPVLCAVLAYLLFIPLSGADLPALGVCFLCLAVLIPFYWDAVSAVLAVLGCFWKHSDAGSNAKSLKIAILVLLFDEKPEPVMERAARLLSSLANNGGHTFGLHILSDSRLHDSVQREGAMFKVLSLRHPHYDMSYVHRDVNRDYKSGNLRSWIRSSGHSYDAMLVLDADSVMESDSVIAMANALASDPGCALVQSVPRVLPGLTLWQSMQSFASHFYGATLGKGLALVSGDGANYYGHNALVRIKAFATSAGLPHLAGEPPFGGVIMSHDFVEAALLRRAGWRVRLLPDVSGSFEETPDSLRSFLIRDRRWCHGNLQHLSLLKVPGLAATSRFHLLQGAMTYLSAPFWLAALVLWTIAPVQFALTTLVWPALMIAIVLLLPRLCGLVSNFKNLTLTDLYFAAQELILSSLIAPALMVQRSRMVLSILLGKPSAWSKSSDEQQTLILQFRLFAIEVILGLVFAVAWSLGLAAALILTAALPLLLAPLLAHFVSRQHQHPRWSTHNEN